MRAVAALGLSLVLATWASANAFQSQQTPPAAPAAEPSPTATPAPEAAQPAPPPTAIPATAVPTATPTPTPMPGQRLIEPPVISILKLPSENPYGVAVEEPAALTARPAFADIVLPVSQFVAVRVDATGKVVGGRIARDPIPSLSAETKRTLERWSFDPGARGGAAVETWQSLRLDLQVEVRSPKTEMPTLTPVTPATPLPVPLDWGPDAAWYDAVRAAPAADGTVPVEQLDTLANPKRTKWSADSYKGPFSCRFWVKISAAGKLEKSVPLQASDPVLIPYMRRVFPAWQFKPARAKGQPADSWNELSLSGQIVYAVELKQIEKLRKTLP